MKKLLVFIALLALGSGAFAQNAGLTIDNGNSLCDVTVSMVAGNTLPGMTCAYKSVNFTIPAGYVWHWCSVWEFQGTTALSACSITTSSPGLYAPGWAFGGPITPALFPTFEWTALTYQPECPVTPPCNIGGSFDVACVPSCLAPFTSPCVPISVSPACPGATGDWIVSF